MRFSFDEVFIISRDKAYNTAFFYDSSWTLSSRETMRSIVSVAQNLKRIYSETNCSIFKEFDVKIKDFRIDPLATKFYAIYQS